ncbi:YoaK family protein [Dactylosporangium sp. NPDC000244]|uniref:YoaK family protein n=1 Tax=Dactylosporangium sp. NPDC000244 TaxID=3154365 RepID=UPI00332DA505
MLALTFSTGVVDAVGYLGLDRVFTGNMTGNVVILGMALAGAEELSVVGPLLALGGFIIGAALAGWTLRGRSAGWSWRTTGLLTLTAGLLLACGAVLLGVTDPAKSMQVTVATVLGAAMGVQAATARHIAVKDVTTVVVTSTITAWAAGLTLPPAAHADQGLGTRRVTAVVLILGGAAVGAALLHWHASAGLLVAGLIVAAVAVLGGRISRV